MCFNQLALPFRLVAGDVENRIHRIGDGRLNAMVVLQTKECAIIGADVVVQAAGELPFRREVNRSFLQQVRADSTQRGGNLIARRSWRRTGTGYGLRTALVRNRVPKIEQSSAAARNTTDSRADTR